MNTEYDLNDMEMMEGKGSTSPEKRKETVRVLEIGWDHKQTIESIMNALTVAKGRCTSNGWTDDTVHIDSYGDDDVEKQILVVRAKRLETDQEYRERQVRIVEAKARKKEFDTKKFYELKKELGL